MQANGSIAIADSEIRPYPQKTRAHIAYRAYSSRGDPSHAAPSGFVIALDPVASDRSCHM